MSKFQKNDSHRPPIWPPLLMWHATNIITSWLPFPLLPLPLVCCSCYCHVANSGYHCHCLLLSAAFVAFPPPQSFSHLHHHCHLLLLLLTCRCHHRGPLIPPHLLPPYSPSPPPFSHGWLLLIVIDTSCNSKQQWLHPILFTLMKKSAFLLPPLSWLIDAFLHWHRHCWWVDKALWHITLLHNAIFLLLHPCSLVPSMSPFLADCYYLHLYCLLQPPPQLDPSLPMPCRKRPLSVCSVPPVVHSSISVRLFALPILKQPALPVSCQCGIRRLKGRIVKTWGSLCNPIRASLLCL